jgi:hypothetical protein
VIRASFAAAAVLALVASAAPARAQIAEGRAHPGGLAASVDRPVGIAEFGVGWLTLPGAQVCGGITEESCNRGDTSLALEGWQLFRPNLRFAFGAGLTLALVPTTDAPRENPKPVEGEPQVERDHSRGYLTIEGITRYYPFVGESLEAWVGVTGGLLVLSDTFDTKSSRFDKAYVGGRGVTIRSEGYSIGLAAGMAYALAPNWSLGSTLRYGNWFLPDEAEADSIGDHASLTGRNTMFSLAFNIAYRIAL